MKSPAEQNIIQIDLTNACTHSCSNCTRFCGHYKKNFFVDYDHFKKAVDSLQNYPNMVGIMGGEPTIHPKFEKLIQYYAEKIPKGGSEAHRVYKPINDFAQYIIDYMNKLNGKRALFSSLGKGYYKNFEIIQNTFDYQCINDHKNPGLHQSLMINRKEMGIPDDEWFELRDNCWIQNLWSSSITPKGAFFCEVAGALDMLFDGPGGWKIEKNWWQRTPDEFKDQLHWCELCGAALQTPRRPANEEFDDSSAKFAEKLRVIQSPKEKKGKVHIVKSYKHIEDNNEKPSIEWYVPEKNPLTRFDDTNKSLYPKTLNGILIIDKDDCNFAGFANIFDNFIVVSDNELILKKVAKFATFHYIENLKTLSTSNIIDNVQSFFKLKDWITVLNQSSILRANFHETIMNKILNTGTIFFEPKFVSPDKNGKIANYAPNEYLALDTRYKNDRLEFINNQYFIFNINAQSYRSKSEVKLNFIDLWVDEKQIDLSKDFFKISEDEELIFNGKVMKETLISTFKTLEIINKDVVLFGAGHHTRWLLAILKEEKIKMPLLILDDNPNINNIQDIKVVLPEKIKLEDFDIIVISADKENIMNVLEKRTNDLFGEIKIIINPYSRFDKLNFRKI